MYDVANTCYILICRTTGSLSFLIKSLSLFSIKGIAAKAEPTLLMSKKQSGLDVGVVIDINWIFQSTDFIATVFERILKILP